MKPAYLISELERVWRSVVDSNYGRRFVESGEGNGYEVYTQAFAQFRRVSQAIAKTLQSMFILPHSSQVGDPASGGARAQVNLTVSRASVGVEQALVFGAGDVVFADETTDHGENGPVIVLTGRRYQVTTTTVIGPGQLGPVTVPCESTKMGTAGNNAQIGNIRRFHQPSAGSANQGASVKQSAVGFDLIATPNPDVPVPAHVGRYVQFTAGSNIGKMRRVIGFREANSTGGSIDGGTLVLAATGQWTNNTTTGTFKVGEKIASSTGIGIVWYQDATRIVFDRISGTFAAAQVLTGAESGAQTTLGSVESAHDLVSETATASWRVLDWENDLGLTVTNDAEPTGGSYAMLDELGAERKVYRANSESDDAYRKRVAKPADVVSPNALRRAANRALRPLGKTGVLREVGLELFRGFFYDGNPASTDPEYAWAYDMDFNVRPQDKLKVLLDYADFRAFFLMGIPKTNLGDFGFFYDNGSCNAYDAAPFNAFYDGYPLTTAAIQKALWQDLNAIKGGGVGFSLFYEEP